MAITKSAEELLVRTQRLGEASGTMIHVTPESADWEYCSLIVQKLASGERWSHHAEQDEFALIPLGGTCAVECGGEHWEIGGRRNPFAGPPLGLYLPVGSSFTVTATAALELAVAGARATKTFPARLIRPEEIATSIRGAGNAARQINDVLPPSFPADRLILVEVYTPSGNWSSYPPHKHDVSNMPIEADVEEIYYYRIDPVDGFALQRLYTHDGSFDAAWTIRDGDLLLVQEGYHAFCMAHGYTGYYLNVLAGNEPVRTIQPSDDPRYGWVRSTWDPALNAGMSSYQHIDERQNGPAGRQG